MNQIYSEKPKGNEPWDIIIVGSGPASFTASIYTTRGAASTLILGGVKWGGQLMLTTEVDNFPGLPGIQGPELMQRMRDHALMFGGEMIEKNVEKIDFDKKPFELIADGEVYKARSIIIATGAETKWLGVPGEDKLLGRGVSSCAPCDAPFYKGKKVIVVGGGDSAMEEALVLTKHAEHVTIVHRRATFRASMAMQKRIEDKIKSGDVSVLWDTEVEEMIGENILSEVLLKTKVTSDNAKKFETTLQKHKGQKIREQNNTINWRMPVGGLFVAIGHTPATDIFKGSIELDEKGYIKVENKTKTNIPGVFVAGDVHDHEYRQAITAAGFGSMAAIDALKYLDE